MENLKFKITQKPSLSVPIEDADRLISASDGDSALLYLYILRHGGEFCLSDASRDLRLTEKEIFNIADKLKYMNLIQPINDTKLRPAQELPEYSSEEITVKTGGSGEFQVVVDEAQRIFGRVLSSTELKKLFGIYDYLGFPPEVMLVLINHCVEECKAMMGPGKLPTMARIEKAAYAWSDNEVMTLDAAEEYIKKRQKYRTESGKIKDILQIRGRELSSTEASYVESWIEMDFELKALDMAYDKTVTRTGQLHWKYMDSILKSWHEKGLHTVEEISQGDHLAGSMTRGRDSQKSTEESAPQSGSLERMKRIYEKLNNS